MKKKLLGLWSIALIGAITLVSCEQSAKDENAENTANENAELRDSIRQTLAYQDSLFALINEITDGMNQIKYLEKVTTVDVGGEATTQKDKLKNDISSIQDELKQRREKLAALESKLAKSNGLNETLQKTIENLKAQIEEQEATIETLRGDLERANRKIANLGNQVDSLNTTVRNVRQQKAVVEEEKEAMAVERYTCFYVVGTSKELKQHNILKSGFLRKTKLMQGDFDQSYFTRSDMRTLRTINLHSSKAKVLTNHPDGSYEISDNGGNKVLHVISIDRFWSLSNYLVIQVD